MSIKVTYEDTCLLTSDNNQSVVAEILDFNPQKYLSATVNRKVKVTLMYIPKRELYIGNMAGMELYTTGPKETITYEGRRR